MLEGWHRPELRRDACQRIIPHIFHDFDRFLPVWVRGGLTSGAGKAYISLTEGLRHTCAAGLLFAPVTIVDRLPVRLKSGVQWSFARFVW
jgi:hypothetical protein